MNYQIEIKERSALVEDLRKRAVALRSQLASAKSEKESSFQSLKTGKGDLELATIASLRLDTLSSALSEVESELNLEIAAQNEAVAAQKRLEMMQGLAQLLEASKARREAFFAAWHQAALELEAIFAELDELGQAYTRARKDFELEAGKQLQTSSYGERKEEAPVFLQELAKVTGAPTQEAQITVMGGNIGGASFWTDNGLFNGNMGISTEDLPVSRATRAALVAGFQNRHVPYSEPGQI